MAGALYPNSAVMFGYLDGFRTPEGRADMADRFKAKADELGLAIEVIYE